MRCNPMSEWNKRVYNSESHFGIIFRMSLFYAHTRTRIRYEAREGENIFFQNNFIGFISVVDEGVINCVNILNGASCLLFT